MVGNVRGIPAEIRHTGGRSGCRQAGWRERNGVRRFAPADDRPRLTGAVRAVVVRGVDALHPPVGLVDHAVFADLEASRIDFGRQPRRWIVGATSDDGPSFATVTHAAVLRGINALHPPVSLVGHAVFGRGHAGRVDGARRPVGRAGGRRCDRWRRDDRRCDDRRGYRRRCRGRTPERRDPFAYRGRILADDIGKMQFAQRRVVERIGLVIGRNRNNHRPVDFADGELTGREPAEIKNICGGIKCDVGVCSPRPNDLCRRHGAPPRSLKSAAPLTLGQS